MAPRLQDLALPETDAKACVGAPDSASSPGPRRPETHLSTGRAKTAHVGAPSDPQLSTALTPRGRESAGAAICSSVVLRVRAPHAPAAQVAALVRAANARVDGKGLLVLHRAPGGVFRAARLPVREVFDALIADRMKRSDARRVFAVPARGCIVAAIFGAELGTQLWTVALEGPQPN